MVDGVFPGEKDLADGDDLVALGQEVVQDAGQGLRRVLPGVVEEDDGAGCDFLRDPLRDLRRGDALPVQGVHIPLDGLHAHLPDGGDDVVVIFAEGAANEGGADAGEGLDLVVAGGDIRLDLRCGHGIEMTVGVGVVHELAATLHDGLGLLGVLVRPVAHHEEGGLHVVLRQDIQDALGVVGAPGGVEADGADLLRAVHAVDGKRAVGGIAQGRPDSQVSGQAQAQDRGQDGRGTDRSR